MGLPMTAYNFGFSLVFLQFFGDENNKEFNISNSYLFGAIYDQQILNNYNLIVNV